MNTENTKIYKGSHGWTAETIITGVEGYDWNITTMKRSNSKLTTTAQAGKKTDSGFSYGIFTDPKKDLGIFESSKATEKSISEAHYKALVLFDELNSTNNLLEEKQKKDYEISPGQVVFLNGNGQNERSHDRKVIYDIQKNNFGINYHYLNIDKLETGVADNIRDIDNKFGIGTYYKKNDVVTLDDNFNNLLLDVIEKEKNAKKLKESTILLNNAEREAKIEEGKKLISIPKNAKSVILAHLKENQSDSQTDYFHHTDSKTIYLQFSTHNRNLFSEMRKAALNSNDVKDLAEIPSKYENKHNYSMGAGIWLGENLHSGWEIRKENINIEDIFIAATEGRVYFPEYGLNDKNEMLIYNIPEIGTTFKFQGDTLKIYNVRNDDNNQKIYFLDTKTNEEFNMHPRDWKYYLENKRIEIIEKEMTPTFLINHNQELQKGSRIEFYITSPNDTLNIKADFNSFNDNKEIIFLDNAYINNVKLNKGDFHEYLELNTKDLNKDEYISPINILKNNLINNKTLNKKIMETQKNEQEIKINYQAVKGNLVEAPVIKTLDGGLKVAEMSIRQSYPIGTPKEGEKQEYVSNFHNAVAFGDAATKIEEQSLAKGDFIEVEGKANFYSFEKDGVAGQNYSNKIIVSNSQKLEKGITPFQKQNNHIELKGNLTKDVEFKPLNSGKEIANISIAHNYKVKGEEKVMYVNATIFNDKAVEHLKKNELEKGSTVSIKGSVEPSQYLDKDQNKRYSISINSNFITIDKSKEQVVDKDNDQAVDVSKENTKSKKVDKKNDKGMSA